MDKVHIVVFPQMWFAKWKETLQYKVSTQSGAEYTPGVLAQCYIIAAFSYIPVQLT